MAQIKTHDWFKLFQPVQLHPGSIPGVFTAEIDSYIARVVAKKMSIDHHHVRKMIADNEEELISTASEKPAMQQYLEAVEKLKEDQEYSEEEWNNYFKFDVESMAFISLSENVKMKLLN